MIIDQFDAILKNDNAVLENDNTVSLSYIKLESTRDRLRYFVHSISFVRFRLFVRSFPFVIGGNVILPYFLRCDLYRQLYSLWKSVM